VRNAFKHGRGPADAAREIIVRDLGRNDSVVALDSFSAFADPSTAGRPSRSLNESLCWRNDRKCASGYPCQRTGSDGIAKAGIKSPPGQLGGRSRTLSAYHVVLDVGHHLRDSAGMVTMGECGVNAVQDRKHTGNQCPHAHGRNVGALLLTEY
jgi:hypothetical protein